MTISEKCDNKIKNKYVKKKYLTATKESCMITKVIRMNEILEQTLLFDFYGELLTEHQKDIYAQFMLEDLSLSEIAQDAGISRQGVHDLVKRCQKILEGYEEKLHLVEKFLAIKGKVHEMNKILDKSLEEQEAPEVMAMKIRKISDTIIEEL